MKYWIVKSEPEDYSIEDLKRDRRAEWTGVRNYQARNFLRAMEVGDELLFYHSNAEPSGVAGVAVVERVAEADPTQFDKKSDYYDPKATKESPRWFCPRVKFVRKFDLLVPLSELKEQAALKELQLLKPGNRLSVMPLSAKEYQLIVRLAS